MSEFKVLEKLNDVSKKYESASLNNSFTRFYVGDLFFYVLEICKKIAPNGRVAIISTKDSFQKTGVKLKGDLIKCGIKPIDIVVDGDNELSVDNACNLFNLPDDTRVVINLSNDVIPLSTYFCSIKRLPLIAVLDNNRIEGILSSRIVVKNGETFDYVLTEISRYVVIDERIIDKDNNAFNFAKVLSRTICLSDYRINSLINKESVDVFGYNLYKDAILSTYNIFKENVDKQCVTLIQNALTIELVNFYNGGKFLDFSSVKSAEFLLFKNGKVEGNTSLELYGKLIGLYYLMFCGEYENLPKTPDYIERVNALVEKLGVSDSALLSNFNEQVNKYRENEKNIKALFEKLKGEIKSQNNAVPTIYKIYTALNGKSILNENVIDALKYAGDLPFNFNGATLLRESGILEYL